MGLPPELPPLVYDALLREALGEDLGSAGDITTDAIVAEDATATARIVARKAGCLAGGEVASLVFRLIDPDMEIARPVAEGAEFSAGAELMVLTGRARALLTGERTALNLMGRMCGIATATAQAVRAVAGTRAAIVCTRKTMPGLRALDKYAVRAGGGSNHRFGLYDAVLIKDNHVAHAGSIGAAVAAVRASVGHLVKIEVEVDTIEQLAELLDLKVDAVLLDNMDPAALARAVALVDGRILTEASGGITPETVGEVANSGVDLISLGWLTHSVRNLDIGLDFDPV